MIDKREATQKGIAGDHLANERTFLAWIRTSIGIMGFGFVVVKFSLFVRQIGTALGTSVQMRQTGYSHVIGIALVALGALIIILSYLRYNRAKSQLDQGIYFHSSLLIKILTIFIFLVSMLLLVYLLKTT